MKRMLLVLLVIALCIPFGALAEETLQIVNCQDWVSLRSAPDSDSERLAQVPLGAYVTGEYDPYSEFSYCSYEGVSGYILNEYLEAPALAAQVDNLTVLATRSYSGSGEIMEVACLDAGGGECWRRTFESPYRTELNCTDAFVAGTAENPMVIVHVSGVGLTALDPETGGDIWTLGDDVVNLGGSLSCAVGEDGTMYLGGYYGPDPVAISVDGELLWQSSSVYGEGDDYPLEFWWLYELELGPDGLIATYDMGMDDQGTECGGEVLYSLEGELLSYRYLYDMY
ncbi:MAG: PQQ-binding-like beta-propeller repeat protein [Clostridia bacterium]|nr:PQQ-binding-like beta-propeller repeat protein [Clostridia bacterium]